MSETHATPKPTALNVEERLLRASALVSVVENIAAVLPSGASGHDFSSDPEFFQGLVAVAGLIRDDVAAARSALTLEASQRESRDAR